MIISIKSEQVIYQLTSLLLVIIGIPINAQPFIYMVTHGFFLIYIRILNTKIICLFNEVNMARKLAAEFFGTFWLVFGGCGSAIFAAAYPELGIGFVGWHWHLG